MFEDDDEDDIENAEDHVETPFEIWIDENWFYLPLDLRKEPWDDFELLHFYTQVFENVKKELTPLLSELAEKQFPIIKNEFRPLVVERINDYINDRVSGILWKTFTLLYNQKLGVNLREKYPKMESWIPFYARPHEPKLYDISFFDGFPPILTEEYKLQEIEKMNRDVIEYFNWEETRRRDFIDTVQSVLLKYFKQLYELDSDGWIMYSVFIGDEYGNYQECFDYIHGFINYELPEEFINLKYEEYRIKLEEAINNRTELTLRRIDE